MKFRSSIILIAMFAFSHVYAQSSAKGSGFSQIEKHLNDIASKEDKSFPKDIPEDCTGVFQVRAAIVKHPGVFGQIKFLHMPSGSGLERIHDMKVRVTLEDAVFRTPQKKDDGETREITTSSDNVNKFQMSCRDVWSNEAVRFKVSGFPSFVTEKYDSVKNTKTNAGKKYQLKYIRIIESGDIKGKGMYNAMHAPEDLVKFAPTNSGNVEVKRSTEEYPKDKELAVASGSGTFIVDLLYSTPFTPGPAKSETANISYNYPSCQWDFDSSKATGMDKFREAMDHNISNGYACEIFVTAGASNTGVADSCKKSVGASSDAQANQKLAEKRAEAIAQELAKELTIHGEIKSRGVVGSQAVQANSSAASDQQFLEIKIGKCVKK